MSILNYCFKYNCSSQVSILDPQIWTWTRSGPDLHRVEILLRVPGLGLGQILDLVLDQICTGLPGIWTRTGGDVRNREDILMS